mgnify:CR=1 FL=1
MVLRTGTSQNVDVSVPEVELIQGTIPLSYTGQDGTLIGTDFMRISGKISLDTDVSNYFRLYTNLNFGYAKNNITNGIYGKHLPHLQLSPRIMKTELMPPSAT